MFEVLCHSSQGQPLQREGPDISRLHPALQQQWDHADNAHLGPIDIMPGTARKVSWTCDQCPDGHPHSWEASVNNRTRGNGCPQCCGRKVCKHNSLATKACLVAAQWDYEENAGTPDDVVAQSNKVVAWLCGACGNKWSAAIDSRVGKKRAGCPKCADHARSKKQIKHPTFADSQDPRARALMAEWDHERNAPQGNFPHNISLKSHKQIFWLCHKCPEGREHSWSARPCDRMKSSRPGCPYCAGHAACKCNSLQSLDPTIAAEWDHSKNQGQPSDYTASSNRWAWWFSPERGSWEQTISSRTVQRLKRNQQKHKSAS